MTTSFSTTSDEMGRANAQILQEYAKNDGVEAQKTHTEIYGLTNKCIQPFVTIIMSI